MTDMPDTRATDKKEAKPGVLAEHYLFSGFSGPQRHKLSASSRALSLKAGETLFYQGDKAKYFYLVMTGQIKL